MHRKLEAALTGDKMRKKICWDGLETCNV